MSVKLFFETHGRFPTTDEFRLIRTFKQHQPDTISECKELLILNDEGHNPVFCLVRAARLGNMQQVARLAPIIGAPLDATANVLQPQVIERSNVEHAPSGPHPAYRQTPTALCAAAQGGHLDIMAYLLDNKATVDCRPPHNRTALLFASESGGFNAMNFLIGRGATYFTYSDQQIESYYMSYTIRQSITRRELSYVLPGDLLPGIILDYLGLGGHRTRNIERLAPVNLHNKNAFGSRPIPDEVVTPVPKPHPCPIDLGQAPILQLTFAEYDAMLKELGSNQERMNADLLDQRNQFVYGRYNTGNMDQQQQQQNNNNKGGDASLPEQ
eukprot:UN01313